MDYRDYVDAVSRRTDEVGDDFGLLPSVLARASLDVLPADGAGLSVLDGLRIPLGASDDTAARAERLQITLGVGPCLEAAASGEPSVLDQGQIAERWPLFHSELVGQTPYRSVMSLPIRLGDLTAAHNLYSTDPRGARWSDPAGAMAAVAKPMAELLTDLPTVADRWGFEVPVYLLGEPAQRRLDVWVAVGMIRQTGALRSRDALAVLRAYAVENERTIDDVAASLVAGSLAVDDVVAA